MKKANRDHLEKLIEDEDPFLLTLAPVCGPWSSWQYINMARDENTREKIIQQRKEWYPVLAVCGQDHQIDDWPKVVKFWLKTHGHRYFGDCAVWRTSSRSLSRTRSTDELLELVRIDQCMCGLMDEEHQAYQFRRPPDCCFHHVKMKELLQLRCVGATSTSTTRRRIKDKESRAVAGGVLCFSIIMGAS